MLTSSPSPTTRWTQSKGELKGQMCNLVFIHRLFSDDVNLSTTRYLNLSNNLLKISNSIHHSLFGTFKALVGLEQLDLSFNQINLTSVDQYVKDVHPILTHLNYINLRGNPLVRLEEHIFYGLRKSPLKELNFQGCELESIDPRK